jgi:hypothetical protein
LDYDFSQYYRSANIVELSWDEARRLQQILDYLGGTGERINVAKFKQIPDMREYFLSRVGKKELPNFEVSKLGVIKEAEESLKSPWRTERTIFSRSAFVSGSAISVGINTGPDGCFMLGLCRQEGIVTEKLVDNMIDLVRSEIHGTAGRHLVGHSCLTCPGKPSSVPQSRKYTYWLKLVIILVK